MVRHRTVVALVLALAVAVGCQASDATFTADPPITAPTSTTTPSDRSTTSAPADTGPELSTRSTAEGQGALGAGDPYYPRLGNGGYDVGHYDLDLAWRPDGRLEGTATITLTALIDLRSFSLDLSGLTVSSVTVDGRPASVGRIGRELVMDLEEPVRAGAAVEVVVGYAGTPEPVSVGTDIFEVGWHTEGDGVYVASEPAGAATWFPGNDHPSDKATFRFRLTVPTGFEAAANGTGSGPVDNGDGTTTWTYESDVPMATYLATVVIGDDYVFDTSTAPGGLPLRDVVPERLVEAARADFAVTADVLAVFTDWFGPYPFDTYGHAVVDEPLGFALENQTLSLFGNDLITGNGTLDRIVAHELAHQWFGNSVSPSTWQDIWLNEGFATYAEWVWEQESGGASIARSARAAGIGGNLHVPPGDPGAQELFQPTVYVRGALTLYALSLEIGDEAFRDLLVEWHARHAGGSASTADLVALAEELSGRSLDDFFERWLYEKGLPEIP